jgi:hypothetical protein
MMSYFNIRDFSQLVDKASIYEESLKENATEYADQKRKTQGTGTSVGGAGPAKRMAVGSFPPQRHKDVPLVTLQLRHKGIRRQSCAKSITVCIGGFVGRQLELAIAAASLGTSVKTA